VQKHTDECKGVVVVVVVVVAAAAAEVAFVTVVAL